MTEASAEARKTAKHQAEVEIVGAEIGLPASQRRGDLVSIEATSMDGKPRPLERTVKKLTRAERLFRSGAIEKYHVEAINRYIDAAEIAYGSCMQACAYGEGSGGSSPTGAAAAVHTRLFERAHDSDLYLAAREALPGKFVHAFERTVLENHPLGAVGLSMWPSSSSGFISKAMRDLIRTCADCLCHFFKIEGDPVRTSLLVTMNRLDAAVKAQKPDAAPPRPVSTAIRQAIARAGDADGLTLLLARTTMLDLCRELDADPAASTTYLGLPIAIIDHWQFGWIVQRC